MSDSPATPNRLPQGPLPSCPTKNKMIPATDPASSEPEIMRATQKPTLSRRPMLVR
jgi:hypothetical protein